MKLAVCQRILLCLFIYVLYAILQPESRVEAFTFEKDHTVLGQADLERTRWIGPQLPQAVAIKSERKKLQEHQKNTVHEAGRNRSGSVPDKEKTPSVEVAGPRQEQIIQSVKVIATGYTAGYESTGKNPDHPQYGITYSGVKVRRDQNTVSTIAADPKVFPLGSILYIPGYGYGIVADIGSAIKGNKIDLYYATTKQVFKEWGKKEVEVHVIKMGKGKCTEEMLQRLDRTIKTYKSIPAFLPEEAI